MAEVLFLLFSAISITKYFLLRTTKELADDDNQRALRAGEAAAVAEVSAGEVCGPKSVDVDETVVEDRKKRLDDLSQGYKPGDIFNCDETGLFYRALPTRSLVACGDSCKGGKHSKERITIHLCVSATGEKLMPLVIGKSANPRCFRSCNPLSLK